MVQSSTGNRKSHYSNWQATFPQTETPCESGGKKTVELEIRLCVYFFPYLLRQSVQKKRLIYAGKRPPKNPPFLRSRTAVHNDFFLSSEYKIFLNCLEAKTSCHYALTNMQTRYKNIMATLANNGFFPIIKKLLSSLSLAGSKYW